MKIYCEIKLTKLIRNVANRMRSSRRSGTKVTKKHEANWRSSGQGSRHVQIEAGCSENRVTKNVHSYNKYTSTHRGTYGELTKLPTKARPCRNGIDKTPTLRAIILVLIHN